MSRVRIGVQGPSELDRVWGTRPVFFERFMRDHSKSMGLVDPVLVELCRLQLAQTHQCEFAQQLRYRLATEAGLTEEKIAALSNYYNSPLFSHVERVCIGFTEQFAMDPSSVGDEEIARLSAALGPEPMIYLLKAISVMDMLQRSMVAFALETPDTTPAAMPEFVLRPAA